MKWISIKDRLPKLTGSKSIPCLVYMPGYMCVRQYNEYHKCWDQEDGDDIDGVANNNITHWMELPDKPVS